jgi:hypothetical protein
MECYSGCISTHSFLATLFCRLLLDDPDPTAKWCESEIKLIYKDSDKNDPAIFRPILLTSCVGKIYHQILADRMTLYLSSNGLIDTAVQCALCTVHHCAEGIHERDLLAHRP